LDGAGRIVSNEPTEKVIHATCVQVGGKGVLLLGPPGSGKSDLALRLIDTPGYGIGSEVLPTQLVADDQVKLTRIGDHLEAEAPEALAALLEVRGLGIVRVARLASTRIDLAVNLRPPREIERLPDIVASRYAALGVSVPLVEIDPAATSAPARVRAAVLHLFSPENG
jgi:HPr kinase/phosphorylase